MENVFVWEDDPSSGADVLQVPQPVLAEQPLAMQITTAAPEAKLYDKKTAEFRYWAAAGALDRGRRFWRTLAPNATWEPARTLRVILDEGVDLNAFYDRQALNFFHDRIADGTTVFSGESPDVVCHEMGHAVLDALRPELFDAANLETPAFHESFGDMSAMLTALQVPEFRASVLEETRGQLDRSSTLSRLAEQLGAAIRERSPDAVDPDCLRNAANSFTYQDSESLPARAPASMISQEPHSLSRVFTGAFLEVYAGMVAILSSAPTADDLATAAKEAGSILVVAVQSAPVVPEFYSQVAAAMIEADANGGGKFGDALKSAFVRRGILSLQSASTVGALQAAASAAPMAAAMAAAAAGRVTDLPLQAIDASQYGLGSTPLFVHVPAQLRRIVALASAPQGGIVTPPSSDRAARVFVEHLMRLGRVDFGSHGVAASRIAHPRTRKTHEIRVVNGALVLKRKLFYC
jgi:hypothetical protein